VRRPTRPDRDPGVTAPSRSANAAVHWLTAQAVVFGMMAALLGIVANALFLDAYGSEWLPATYIAIGIAGIVVSGAVARAARSADLVPIALTVLGGAAVGIAAAWAVAAGGDGAWVSVPLLVLFPILIQLGFVFIGGQGGRLLDIAGIKAHFPRIMAGFPAGAVLGGLLGAWLVSLLGRTEDLLLATAVAQGAFTVLVWVTSRRYASRLHSSQPGGVSNAATTADQDLEPRPSLRQLLVRPFVALILAYQVLSALGSQLADFLVFDRAYAQYPDPADLARFLAVYTAVMNILSIAFLFVLAGPLLRRYGLRLGIAANPFVLTVLAAAMIAVLAVAGAASLALLVVVSAARIADIALTDGTTRTSINATYQVLPERERLSIQASVEGIGVPVAIGISGALILVLNALPFALAATIVVTALVCLVWTWSAVLLYRAYGPALVDALHRRRLLDVDAGLDPTADDEAVARGLLASTDPRTTRLGLDLLATMSSPSINVELTALADDPRPDIRLVALRGLAAAGDEPARRRLATEVRTLLTDDDPAVRSAALDAVGPDDGFAVEAAIAALGDPATLGAAAGAIERLGDAVVPSLARLLDAAGTSAAGTPAAGPPVLPASPLVTRLVRAAATRTPARDEVLRRHVRHPDRDLGLVVMERLTAPGPATDETAQALDTVLSEDVRHAGSVLAAIAAVTDSPRSALDGGAPDDPHDGEAPVRRALADALDLIRRRVIAGRLARHGTDRLGPVMAGLTAGGREGALAVEALEVALGPVESKHVVPVLHPDLAIEERLARLGSAGAGPPSAEACLRDLIQDAGDQWRSPWLRACAIHAGRARGLLDQVDLARARALGDPVVDEELGLATTAPDA
jgi:hypothetical protein